MILNPFTGEVLNEFCPTGDGGGVDPSCGKGKSSDRGKSKVTAKQKRILDQIDTKMLEANKEFDRTREESEKIFGGTLSPPSWVDWTEIRKATQSDMESLLKSGLIERRLTSFGQQVRRTNVPQDFYRSSRPT